MKYIIYKVGTGRIVSMLNASDTDDHEIARLTIAGTNDNVEDDRFVDYLPYDGNEDISDATHYLIDGQLMSKTPFPPFGYGNGTVSRIPEWTMVRWPDGEETVETDGFVEFSSNVSMTIQLTMFHTIYLEKTVEAEYVV